MDIVVEEDNADVHVLPFPGRLGRSRVVTHGQNTAATTLVDRTTGSWWTDVGGIWRGEERREYLSDSLSLLASNSCHCTSWGADDSTI
ncbi:hypothetical protein PoB_000646000 [Plakobranchus ocellatus]|uniref:Uncharacterized protein n=1 Tax=Plakobranchus ocellatus TaxID=259542 RepID=A0AAV3YA24_9GAST|nr:hypothetical protein PoB_000646000 [Plakobranchus ocellatus]